MHKHILDNLSAYTDELRQQYHFPGISIAVISKGDLYTAASGVLNTETGVEATTDSVFQIGSITKVFTTTLIMQLVDEGRICLEGPVIDYLPDFKVGCDYATHHVTIRQLLSHTSGLEGDLFAADKPSGGNQLARYIDRCELLPQSHPPGEGFAYSNSAFCIAGRLVEVVTGKTWHRLIQEKIVEPLGITHAVITGTESSRYRVARGHLPAKGANGWELAHDGFPRGMDPVGSSLAMTATDVVRFAKAHLYSSRGVTTDWLSQSIAQAMQKLEVSLPSFESSFITGWGLGWGRFDSGDVKVFGHDGSTVGQCAMLRIVPEHDLIFACLINSDVFMTAMPKLFRDVMLGLVGVDYVEAEPAETDLHLDNYCSYYKSMGQEYEIYRDAGHLKCRVLIKNAGHEVIHWRLKAINKHCFAAYLESGQRSLNIHFLFEHNSESPSHLSAFHRLNQRVS